MTMNEREIAEKMIKDGEKMILEAKYKLKQLEITYSIGDRFKHVGGREYMLSVQSVPSCEQRVSLTNLDNGCLWNGSHKVKNSDRITRQEFDHIAGGDFNRYYDAVKETLV